MALAGIEITNFRRIQFANLELHAESTLIWGENAAGKTSVLEAIHLLSSGRSFRSPQITSLIGSGHGFLRVIGRTDQNSRIALQASPALRELRIDAREANLAEAAALLPVCVIDPTLHKLVEEGPSRRRRFLDWGTFHVEPRFLPAWRRYDRALANRNASLRAKGGEKEVRAWDKQLVDSGSEVTEYRMRYLAELRPWIDRYLEELLPLTFSFDYAPGFGGEGGLAAALSSGWLRDYSRRMTTTGPHRADVQIALDGVPVRERISRGQQKLLATALVLAQLHHYASASARPRPVLLIDDPAAELDVDNLGRLITTVRQIPAQLVVTSLREDDLGSLSFGSKFHVKQGVIVQML